jgi:hypothetical protein
MTRPTIPSPQTLPPVDFRVGIGFQVGIQVVDFIGAG